MVYEKCMIWTENYKNYETNSILWEIKQEIKQHVLIMQQISLCPKYIKRISKCVFLCAFVYANTGLQKVNSGKAICDIKPKSFTETTGSI